MAISAGLIAGTWFQKQQCLGTPESLGVMARRHLMRPHLLEPLQVSKKYQVALASTLNIDGTPTSDKYDAVS